MPQNPFTKYQNYVTKPPRNSVDLSFRNNGTFSLGTETPVCCLEVNPGETFSIESAFGLKFFPMPFPIQTPMNASLHFYYVRNRTMWKDWVDFIYRNKSHDVIPHPTLNRPASDTEFWKTGGLADRLGVPTIVVDDDGNAMQFAAGYGLNYSTAPVGEFSSLSGNNTFNSGINSTSNNFHVLDPRSLVLAVPGFITGVTLLSDLLCAPFRFRISEGDEYFIGYMYGGFASMPVITSGQFKLVLNGCQIRSAATETIADNFEVWCFYSETGDLSDPHAVRCFARLDVDSIDGWVVGSNSIELNVETDRLTSVPEVTGNGKYYFYVCQDKVGHGKDPFFYVPDAAIPANVSSPATSAQISVLLANAVDISSDGTLNPFAGPDPVLPLSSLPFRAYEMVYNAWIRNERLEPLMIDGVPEYNKFCPNVDSGPDAYPYKMYQRNWESDYLTSALPTPQQGIAPVVGVTGLSNVQIQDPESNTIYNFSAEVDNDGETIVSGSFHDPGVPEDVRRTAQQLVIAGFTINDFRNVNSLQRWCENNLRRGLKYRDQVLANTGVKVRYDELDMPEFIGGFSRPVQVTSVTQTTPGGDLGLGDYAGQANCFGSSKHRISHYCDEAGFIIGILSITPIPVYSQLLPKMFLKRTALDYHHPAFNHIGPQPITYAEVCPLQVFYKNPTQDPTKGLTFNDVFGYQRPFYDLLAHVDEVHGQMRTSLRNYVMNRTFSDVPELGADFIHVDPKQLNQVFNMTLEDEDVIMGEIYFRIYAKRPVSLFGQPKIQ